MNMKKTIAAIAAGAVAVSAMATTVSALETTTLNYNLASYLNLNPSVGTAKLTANFSGITLKPNTSIQVIVDTNSTSGNDEMITIGGRYVDNNKSIDNMFFTKSKDKQNYNAVGDAALTNSGTNNEVHTITIPVNEVATAKSYELQADSSSSTEITGGTLTTSDVSGIAAGDATAANTVVNTTNFIKNQVPAGTYRVVTTDGLEWKVYGGDVTFTVGVATDATAVAANDEIEVVWAPTTTTTDYVTLANLVVSVDAEKLSYRNLSALNNAIASGDITIKVKDSDGVVINGDVKGTMSDVERYRMPFMTNLSRNDDIINYLENRHLTGGSDYDSTHGYRNVKAVLNDAVENYDGVTFTFNTAAAGVKYVIVDDATGAYQNNGINVVAGPFGNDWQGSGLAQAQSELYNFRAGAWTTGVADNYNIQAVYSSDWDAINTYTAFGEHTYDWNYAPEGTGFTGYDWGGTNLFAGALIVNERITMSLSNTEYFDWTKTSVSFDWEAIMDNAATTNNYATYIQTLKLATSNMWFWDSMDVVLTVGEADDVSADAGVTSDDDVLDDDDDDIVADDDDEPVADDDDDEPAPVVDEPVAAPVVSNPPTGNASVALAVIPVALAAAAIVAKKRG